VIVGNFDSERQEFRGASNRAGAPHCPSDPALERIEIGLTHTFGFLEIKIVSFFT
jgi:hypothetical protein